MESGSGEDQRWTSKLETLCRERSGDGEQAAHGRAGDSSSAETQDTH